MANKLRVVIIKPSKYDINGTVERFRWGFMPNSTVPHLRSLTPETLEGVDLETHSIDEYVHTDIDYLKLLERPDKVNTLVALVGVQSHQFHRALDLAAYAKEFGCHAVIGGPHVMTCETGSVQGNGISFAVAEGERIWEAILGDAIFGELQPVYGADRRWQQELESPVIVPPASSDLRRYVVPMLGLYPARGCPFSCSFCSVVKIAGRRIRSQSIGTTIDSLKAAQAAGVKLVMFTSDNFNKYPEAEQLLNAMIDERIKMPFFVQCDTQIGRQPELVELMGRAGCYQMFLGVESFSREVLLSVHKQQNRPEVYEQIVKLCRANDIGAHFSNIIGFPTDTKAAIDEHVDTLIEFDPDLASFYVLCPIPGTEQYDEFLNAGMISEKNLDRFDTTNLTWDHPNLSRQEMQRQLFRCYQRFFSARHSRNRMGRLRSSGLTRVKHSAEIAAQTFFHRYCAARGTHPMSGGFKRVKRDTNRDYAELRQRTYGFHLAPLPQNLALPEADQILVKLNNPSLAAAGR
jgi:hypothetical protein